MTEPLLAFVLLAAIAAVSIGASAVRGLPVGWGRVRLVGVVRLQVAPVLAAGACIRCDLLVQWQPLYCAHEPAPIPRCSLLGCPMDGSGVRASAGAPEELNAHGQVSPGMFSQPPGIRRNATPSMQRVSARRCFASRSACSRRARISASSACRSAIGSGWAAFATLAGGVGAGSAWKRALQASPVLRCSQIPAPAMPNSSTAHRPSQGNSQRVRRMGCRYSGRSRSIRPPLRPGCILIGHLHRHEIHPLESLQKWGQG